MNTVSPYITDTAFGRLHLKRYPDRSGQNLQAWNAADLLLLDKAAELGIAPQHILLVNDEQGALSTALPDATLWTDSRLSLEAARRNRALNDCSTALRYSRSSEHPVGDYQLVLLRIPKQLSLLHYQLKVLRECLSANTPVISGGMDKHLPQGLADSLELHIGPTQRYRGQRKARLFESRCVAALTPEFSFWREFHCSELGIDMRSAPNVFSGSQLDIGSRALLAQMPRLPRANNIVDLGCGNGVLGLAALQQMPDAAITFIDESDMALHSAKCNIALNAPESVAHVQYLWCDGFEEYSEDTPQLILCNPPFHQQHTVDDFSGRRLISQSAEALAPGGELWLVANRHLPYKPVLRSNFQQVEQIDQNQKFIVWRAVKAA